MIPRQEVTGLLPFVHLSYRMMALLCIFASSKLHLFMFLDATPQRGSKPHDPKLTVSASLLGRMSRMVFSPRLLC